MGTSKAWLMYEGSTLLAKTVRTVGAAVSRVVVAARSGQSLPELPGGIEVVLDNPAHEGPLAGLVSGLAALKDRCDAALVVPCDHPRLKREFVRRLVELSEGHPAVAIEHEGVIQPLIGVYRVSLHHMLEQQLREGERRAHVFAERCGARIISWELLREVDPELESLQNVNDPDEFRRMSKDQQEATE